MGVGTSKIKEVFMTSNQIAYRKMREDMRANRVKETETNRHNIQSELAALYGIEEQLIRDKMNTGLGISGQLTNLLGTVLKLI